MDKKLSNTSKIESYFDSILPKTLADKIFFGNLPKVISESWNTIVLVDCGTAYQRGAYAMGSVLVYLFAKPFANGQKNVPALSVMESKLTEVIESAHCDHYAVRIGSSYSDYDAVRNLHCDIYSIEVTIS